MSGLYRRNGRATLLAPWRPRASPWASRRAAPSRALALRRGQPHRVCVLSFLGEISPSTARTSDAIRCEIVAECCHRIEYPLTEESVRFSSDNAAQPSPPYFAARVLTSTPTSPRRCKSAAVPFSKPLQRWALRSLGPVARAVPASSGRSAVIFIRRASRRAIRMRTASSCGRGGRSPKATGTS